MRGELKNMKFKRLVKCLIVILVFTVIYSNFVLASGIGGSSLFSGSKRLAQDLTNWIRGAAAVFAILMMGYCFLRKMGADPEKARQWNDRIKMIAGALIGVIVVASLVEIVISYFQG